MGKRLYCGNLPFSATADEIKAIFAEDGRSVTDVHIVTDRETGRSRGFAFVELASDQEAENAIRAVEGRMYGGRALAVKEARDRAPSPGRGFGGGPGGGDRGFGGPRPGGGDRGFGGPRPGGGDRGFGGPRPGGGDRGAGGPPRPGFGGPRGPGGPGGPGGPVVERRPPFPGGRGGYGGNGGGYGGYGRGADFPPEPFLPEPAFETRQPDYSQVPEGGYAPPEDVDYRERGDRGKRGRDRRGGRRRGDDFGGPEW